MVCLLLLTVAKPVYLPFALLLLPAYKRLGWRRAILLCAATIAVCAGAYLCWSYVVRPIIPMAGNDYPGHNPSAQVHFIFAHPLGLAMVFLRTLKVDAHQKILEVIGFFGWDELPLPAWFYKIAYAFFTGLLCLFVANWKRIDRPRLLWGSLTAVSIIVAIFLASFVLWAPVGSSVIYWIQGRYYIPVLAILPFFIPSLRKLGINSKKALAVLVLAFFAISIFATVRTLKHYYYPESAALGKNVHQLFKVSFSQSCPATANVEFARGPYSSITDGKADVPGKFRVVLANENGTILGVSDPVLAGADFPFVYFPGSSHSRWFMHFWTPNRYATLHYWLIRGGTACAFGRELKLKPYYIPNA